MAMNWTREGAETAASYLRADGTNPDGTANVEAAVRMVRVQLAAIAPYTARNLVEADRLLRWIAHNPTVRLPQFYRVTGTHGPMPAPLAPQETAP